MNRVRFLRLGKWVIGAAVVGGTATVAVNCSAAYWTPTKAFVVPEPSAKWDSNWDKREQYYNKMLEPKEALKTKDGSNAEGTGRKAPQPHNNRASRFLILVRHGHFVKEVNDSERLLTELGKYQAELTGKRLKSLGIHFDSIVSSDFNRAIETAKIIFKEIGQDGLTLDIHDPLLQEGHPPAPEPVDLRWQRKLDHQYYEDGPRLEAAFRKYFHRADPEQEKDSFEIIVCHANLMKYFVCRAMQFPAEAWNRLNVLHCSVTVMCIRPNGRVSLRSIGDVGHIPAQLRTNVYGDYQTPV